MGVLETVLREVIGSYLPFIDEELIHIDLLRGTCRVSDLDYEPAPPPVSFLGQLPFELSRIKVGDLEIGASWSGGPELRFEAEDVDVWLREREWNDNVDEVVVSAQSRAKRKTLADGERAEATKNWMQSLVPGLLDSVRLEIRNVSVTVELCSGISLTLRLDGLETSMPSKNFGLNLEKEFKVRCLSVVMNAERGEDVAVVHPLTFSVALNYSKGVLAVDVMVTDRMSIGVDSFLMEQFWGVTERVKDWNRAVLSGRPPRNALKNSPKRLWRYAIRCVSGCTPQLQEGKILQSFRDCQMYTELHIRRLRKTSKLTAAEEKKISDLEQTLDADMILMLRVKARREARAEDVAQFAREGWLSWLLFGSEASSSREKVAKDIFDAFRTLEKSGEAEKPKFEKRFFFGATKSAADWSRALVKVSIPEIDISLSHIGDVVDIAFQRLKVSYQFDSALQSSLLTVALGDILISNNHDIFLSSEARHTVVVNGGFGRGQSKRQAISEVLIVKAQIQPEIGGTSKVLSIFLAPVRIVANPRMLLPMLIVGGRALQVVSGMSGDVAGREIDAARKPLTNGNESAQISLGASYVHFVIPSPDLGNSSEERSFNLILSDVELQTPMKMNVSSLKGFSHFPFLLEGNLKIKLTRPCKESSLMNGRPAAATRAKVPQEQQERILVHLSPHITLCEINGIALSIGEVAVEIHKSDVILLTMIASDLRNILVLCEKTQMARTREIYTSKTGIHKKANEQNERGHPFAVGVDGLVLSFFREEPRLEPLLTATIGRVRVSGSIGNNSNCSAVLLHAERVDVREEQDGSNIVITPYLDHSGLDITLDEDVNVQFGSFSADLKPVSLQSLSTYCKSAIYSGAGAQVSEYSCESNGALSRDEEVEPGKPKNTIITAGSASLGWSTTSSNMELAGLKFRAKVVDGEFSCEMGVKHLRDRSLKSGVHSTVVHSRQPEHNVLDIRPILCVKYGRDLVLDIFIKDLQLCIFRHVVRDIYTTISSIKDAVQAIEELGSPSSLDNGDLSVSDHVESNEPHSSNDSIDGNSDFTTMVKGEDLIISIPGSVHGHEAAGIICTSGKVVVRKASTLIEFRNSSIASTRNACAAKDTDWAIVLPSINVDIFHSEKTMLHDALDIEDPDFNIAGATRLRSKWSVSILNDVSLLLTKAQLNAINASLFDNLLAQDFSDSVLKEGKEVEEEHAAVGEDARPMSVRTILKVETRDVLVELLHNKEELSGAIAEGLASFCAGSVSYRRDQLEHHSRQNLLTVVDRSIVEGSSLCVYNTSRDISEAYRLVLDIHPPNGQMVAIKVSSLMRIDPGSLPATQVEVQAVHPWIMADLVLFQKVSSFFAADPSPTKRAPTPQQRGREEHEGAVAAMKVNISVKFPQVFVPEKIPTRRSRALRIQLCDSGIAGSLFFNRNGSMQNHSLLRLRGIVVSICPPLGTLKDNRRHTVATLAVGDRWSSRQSLSPRMTLDEVGKIACLRRWATSRSAGGQSRPLATISSVTIRLMPHLAITVSALIIRIKLASALELFGTLRKLDLDVPDEPSSPTSPGRPISFKVDKFCISVGSLRCIAKIQYSAENDPAKKHCVVGLTVDTRAGSSAQREQIISKCDFSITMSSTERQNVLTAESLTNVKVKRMAVAISPNGISALSDILRVSKSASTAPGSYGKDDGEDGKIGNSGQLLSQTFAVSIGNFTVSALSLIPIREVLRLTLSDIKAVLEHVGARTVCGVNVGNVYIEDMTASRRASSEVELTTVPYVTMLSIGERVYSDNLRDITPVVSFEERRESEELERCALRVGLSWSGEFKDIATNVLIGPVDMRFDSRSLPEIARCLNEIYFAVLNTGLYMSTPERLRLVNSQIPSSTKSHRVKHFCVNSFRVRLSAHAPSTGTVSLESGEQGVFLYIKSLLQKGLVWAFGREEAHGFEVGFPSVMLRDCEDGMLIPRLAGEYYRVATSLSFVKQFLLQPRLSLQLGGVGLVTYLRVPQLLRTERPTLLLEDDPTHEWKMLGRDEREDIVPSSDSEAESHGSSTETLDLTKSSLSPDKKLLTLAGINFFERPGEGFKWLSELRANPLMGMGQDRYILYTVPEENVGILVTSKRILKIDRMNEEVAEGIELKFVVDCIAEEDVIVVMYHAFEVRRNTRDSAESLAFAPMGDAQCSTLELECHQRPLAVWVGDCINKTRSSAY